MQCQIFLSLPDFLCNWYSMVRIKAQKCVWIPMQHSFFYYSAENYSKDMAWNPNYLSYYFANCSASIFILYLTELALNALCSFAFHFGFPLHLTSTKSVQKCSKDMGSGLNKISSFLEIQTSGQVGLWYYCIPRWRWYVDLARFHLKYNASQGTLVEMIVKLTGISC